MKKIILFALLTALLCGGAFSEGEITVADVAGANDGRLLIKQYGGIGVNTIYYAEDGSEDISFYTFAKADENGDVMYVYEDSDGSVEIMRNGAGVGFDAAENQLFVIGYVLGEYETSLEMNLESLIPKPSEDSTSNKTSGTDDAILFTEEIIYEGEEASIIEYTLDPETLFVREVTEYYRDADGNTFKVAKVSTTVGVDYEIPEELQKLMNPTETRKVTVIADTGEDETQLFEFEPPADSLFMLMYPFEYVPYADAEMTEFYNDSETLAGEGFPAESTLYLGRFE